MGKNIKQLIFGIFALLISHLIIAQETKPVTKESNGFREEFNVLSTDKKVKNGPYKKYGDKDQVLMEGNYENNERTGEWKFYANGVLEQTYDFTTGELKYAKKPDYLIKVFVDGKIQDAQLDTPPLYIGAKAGLNDALNKVMKYPYQALRMGIEGKILASVWVTETDAISDVKVIQGIMTECDAEVVKGLTKIEKNWVAGTKDGNKVKSELFIVIEFKLHENGDATITVL
jgi:hypothetical protein